MAVQGSEKMGNLLERIELKPRVCNGKPVVWGKEIENPWPIERLEAEGQTDAGHKSYIRWE